MAKGTCTVEGCREPRWGLREWCSKHWQRVKAYGTTELPARPSLEEKFWPKVDRSGECWIWTGAVDGKGALLFWDSSTGKQRHANRIAYELTRGRSIPLGQRARRTCGERLCVRPDHLVATPEERFWASVNKTGSCWVCTGYRNEGGYGVFTVGGKSKVATTSHRWSYTHLVGPIPEDLEIDHICLNPPCVNPEHLRLATNKQNGEHRAGATRCAASQHRGVFPVGDKWRAIVRHNQTNIHV